jgi:hypothetical protein
MTVTAVARSARKVSVELDVDGARHATHFAVSAASFTAADDFLLPLLLVPAMARGFDLHLPATMSRRLVDAAHAIQACLCGWDLGLHRAAVSVDGLADRGERRDAVACFFSGGVDSFYSALTHRDEISHLVFVHGFDIPLAERDHRSTASRSARTVATELGRSLIEVETDLRSFSDPFVSWEIYHGAALATVALLLGDRFGTVFIPATHAVRDLAPWGSHPDLDPLWSTETTRLEHDGAEATRVEKAAYLARHEIAMRELRVCWQNEEGAYNCGRCEKCLRTMINLTAVGALERCVTLPHHVNPAAVAALELRGENDRAFARENLEALVETGRAPELANALAACLARAAP